MGSFYSSCSVSGMTLTNQKTSILLLVPGYSPDFSEHGSMIVSNDGCQAFFSPFGFPIHGTYDDYGYIENIVRDRNVEMLEQYFGVSIEEILRNIGDDRDIPENIKHRDFYKTLAMTYFRTEVLEYLESGWDKVDLKNPKKYSSGSKLKELFDILDRLTKTNKTMLNTKTRISEAEQNELLEKSKNKTITPEELEVLIQSVCPTMPRLYDKTYIASLASKNMFEELPITSEFKTEILKQSVMIGSLSWKIRKQLMPSEYGSQEDNWVQLWKFNDFVNDLLVSDIKERSARWGDELSESEREVISAHGANKRDRKINSIID